MDTPTTSTLVPLLLALQFAAFGWRINREISVGDEGRRTWLPVSDILNVLSMLTVVGACVVLPLLNIATNQEAVLAIAFMLIAMHPITLAAHYRLFTREGRGKYDRLGVDWPYVTEWEWVSIAITLVLAGAISYALFR